MVKTESCSVFSNVRFYGVRVFGFGWDYVCSGYARDIMQFCKSLDKVDFVEKLWRNLRKSLWVNCGKVLRRAVDKRVLHILGERFARFGEFCGKFCSGFTHINNSGRHGVLHIFHIAYYYNY